MPPLLPLFPIQFAQQMQQQFLAYLGHHQFIVNTDLALTTQQPLVVLLWQANVTIADVALALVILWVAYNVILGFYGSLEILSRIVLAALASHASLQFISLFILLNNALSAAAIAVAGVPSPADVLTLFGFHLPGASGAEAIQAMIILFMGFLIALQELMRLGVLDMLIVIAPLAFLDREIARLWLAAFFAVLFLQFLQVTAIVLGAALVVSLNAGTNIVSFLAGIAILLFTLQIPRMLGHAVTHTIGGVRSPLGYVQHALNVATQRAMTIIRTFRLV